MLVSIRKSSQRPGVCFRYAGIPEIRNHRILTFSAATNARWPWYGRRPTASPNPVAGSGTPAVRVTPSRGFPPPHLWNPRLFERRLFIWIATRSCDPSAESKGNSSRSASSTSVDEREAMGWCLDLRHKIRDPFASANPTSGAGLYFDSSCAPLLRRPRQRHLVTIPARNISSLLLPRTQKAMPRHTERKSGRPSETSLSGYAIATRFKKFQLGLAMVMFINGLYIEGHGKASAGHGPKNISPFC